MGIVPSTAFPGWASITYIGRGETRRFGARAAIAGIGMTLGSRPTELARTGRCARVGKLGSLRSELPSAAADLRWPDRWHASRLGRDSKRCQGTGNTAVK